MCMCAIIQWMTTRMLFRVNIPRILFISFSCMSCLLLLLPMESCCCCCCWVGIIIMEFQFSPSLFGLAECWLPTYKNPQHHATKDDWLGVCLQAVCLTKTILLFHALFFFFSSCRDMLAMCQISTGEEQVENEEDQNPSEMRDKVDRLGGQISNWWQRDVLCVSPLIELSWHFRLAG